MENLKYTNVFIEMTKKAKEIAKMRHNQFMMPQHFLKALFAYPNDDDTVALESLRKLNINDHDLNLELDKELDSLSQVEGSNIEYGQFDHNFSELITETQKQGKEFGDSFVAPESFVLAVLLNDNWDFTKWLLDKSLSYDIYRKSVLDTRQGATVMSASDVRGASILDKYAQEMVAQARKGNQDPIIGRDQETREVIEILLRKNKNNPLLIGNPGVGKTAILQGLAQKIAKNDVPDELKGVKLYNLDLTSLVSNSGARGQFEGRIEAVMKEVEKSNGRIILFIDEIHNIVGAGNQQGQMDASNIIKPALARGKLHLIGATTIVEYKQSIEKDGALARRFANVDVPEPSTKEAIAMLRGLRARFEKFHSVSFHDDALIEAVKMSKRYIAERYLPDKAIELVDSAGAQVRLDTTSQPAELDKAEKAEARLKNELVSLMMETDSDPKKIENKKKYIEALDDSIKYNKKQWQETKKQLADLHELRLQVATDVNLLSSISEDDPEYKEIQNRLATNKAEIERETAQLPDGIVATVTPDIIDKMVAIRTGIDVAKLKESEKNKLMRLPETLHKRVIGQDRAVETVANAIKRSRTGLGSPDKPIGSFFFMGSTGTGKTQLAKTLAKTLFDDEHNMIRIDMSEYQAKENVNRLVGPPPGYVGYEEGGQLTEAVRAHPYSVILLDEVEKAHPDVLNVMLQVLDDGRLTDGKGRTISFKNTIIIMTSNLGAERILRGWVNFDKPLQKDIVKIIKAALLEHFRPELINRLDDVIIFKPISLDDQRHIAVIYLKEVKERLYESNEINVKFSKKALYWISKDSYNLDDGARPLRRYIESHVETLLADAILNDEIKKGDTVEVIRTKGFDGYHDVMHSLDLSIHTKEDNDPLDVPKNQRNS